MWIIDNYYFAVKKTKKQSLDCLNETLGTEPPAKCQHF